MFDSIDISSLNFMKLYNLYLDNLFTINNPEFEKNFPDIYPAEFRMNKQLFQTYKLPSWIWTVKLLAILFILVSVYENAMTSDEILLISPGWVVMFLDAHRTVFNFSQLVRFAICWTYFSYFHSKNIQFFSK